MAIWSEKDRLSGRVRLRATEALGPVIPLQATGRTNLRWIVVEGRCWKSVRGETESEAVSHTGKSVTVLVEPEEMPTDANSATSTHGSRRAPPKTQRDFIICYDGIFVGHFRSQRRITNRSAFKLIGQQMIGILGEEFDPNHLELFKPVPLKLRGPQSRAELCVGEFNWFVPTPEE